MEPMDSLFGRRRYLSDFNATRMGNIVTDVLVVGGGVAGMRAALAAAPSAEVILVCKRSLQESATRYAQGGVAASLGGDDSPGAHFDDTMKVGSEANDPAAVRKLVTEGPAMVRELIEWGLEVDRETGAPALGREGGHSRNRIVHARGDQTGAAIVDALAARTQREPVIRVFEDCFIIDLLVIDGCCRGAISYSEKYGHQLIWSSSTVLASGGCGQVWRETTNPSVATGDGIAAAFRAGADVADMEFMQFHPTTLYVAGAARSLITEAVRGEGAHLVDRSGERFMQQYHPDAELAPRDVVSLSIHKHLTETRANCVYLDVRHLRSFESRFPHMQALCRSFQIDPAKDLIPVRPSAHYMIGGVITDLGGRTTVGGLFACGEVACSGVHGANRMASNSLLEGLVFGASAGANAAERAKARGGASVDQAAAHRNAPSDRTVLDLEDIRHSLRSVMWRNVGVARRADRLEETEQIIEFWAHYTLDKTFDSPSGWETVNQMTVARLVAAAALRRKGSIGVHFREDGDQRPGDRETQWTFQWNRSAEPEARARRTQETGQATC